MRALSLVAAGSVVVGFAVAQVTGVRSLGGLVLVAAAAWCFVQWRGAAGWPVAVGLVLLSLTVVGGAHLLARVIGAWPSVLTVAAVVGLASLIATRRTLAPDGRG